MFVTTREDLFYYIFSNILGFLKTLEFDPHSSLVVKMNSLQVVNFRKILGGIILKTSWKKRKTGR